MDPGVQRSHPSSPDPVSALEIALGAELLRAKLLGAAPPRIAKRYTVERMLGRGASGVVVAARDDTLDRSVALKLTPALGDPSALAEARALARVDHPNVVRVFDVLVTDTVLDGAAFRLWVVAMQRIEGRSLRVWLREERRSADAILRMFIAAGEGLAAAHREKLVHRDFKPDNVVVGVDEIPRVIDFGFAVHARSSHVGGGVSGAEVAGTDPYLAPEAREGRITRKSDIFAFGVSLVEALTGETTPAGPSCPADVDPMVWGAVRMATDRDPKRRYESMDALLDALRAQRSATGCLRTLGVIALVVFAIGRLEPAYDGWVCGDLPQTWTFQATVRRSTLASLPVGAWGFYEMRVVARERCSLAVEVERLCDSGQPIAYRPDFFLGTGRARVEPRFLRPTRLVTEDIEIRREGRGSAHRYGLDALLHAEGPRGTLRIRRDGALVVEEDVQPVSRSPCLPGRDRRRWR